MGTLVDLRRRFLLVEHPAASVSCVTERNAAAKVTGDLFRLGPARKAEDRFDRVSRARVVPGDMDVERGGGIYHYYELPDGWYEARSTSRRAILGQRAYFQVEGAEVIDTMGTGDEAFDRGAYDRDRLLAGLVADGDVEYFYQLRDEHDEGHRAADAASGWVPLRVPPGEPDDGVGLRLAERGRRLAMAGLAAHATGREDPDVAARVLGELARVPDAAWWSRNRHTAPADLFLTACRWLAEGKAVRP